MAIDQKKVRALIRENAEAANSQRRQMMISPNEVIKLLDRIDELERIETVAKDSKHGHGHLLIRKSVLKRLRKIEEEAEKFVKSQDGSLTDEALPLAMAIASDDAPRYSGVSPGEIPNSESREQNMRENAEKFAAGMVRLQTDLSKISRQQAKVRNFGENMFNSGLRADAGDFIRRALDEAAGKIDKVEEHVRGVVDKAFRFFGSLNIQDYPMGVQRRYVEEIGALGKLLRGKAWFEKSPEELKTLGARPGCCTPTLCATCGPDCGGRQQFNTNVETGRTHCGQLPLAKLVRVDPVEEGTRLHRELERMMHDLKHCNCEGCQKERARIMDPR